MSSNSDSFVKQTVDSLSDEQKVLLEDHFVRQRNKKNFVKLFKFSLSAGVVVGVFVGLVKIGLSVGDSFSNNK